MGVLPGIGGIMAGLGAAGAGIEYVGGKTFDVAGNTSTDAISLTDLTGGLATAPAENDYVVVSWTCNTTDIDMAVTTGYTEIADLYANDTFDCNLGVFIKKMTATPDTIVTIGTSGTTNNRKVGAISVWRGVDLTTPQDVAATTATAINTGLANPPAITPVTAGAVVIAVGGNGHQKNAATFGSGDLTDFLTLGGAATLDQTIGMGWIGPWSAGAVDPAAFTFSDADEAFNAWAACCLALRPAA